MPSCPETFDSDNVPSKLQSLFLKLKELSSVGIVFDPVIFFLSKMQYMKGEDNENFESKPFITKY